MTSAEKRGITTVGAALIAAGIVLTSSNVDLRTFAAVPLALFLPGMAILRAASSPDLNLSTITLSIGLSMAVASIGGLVLNMLGGLSASGWALMLTTTVIGASAISYFRHADHVSTASSDAKPRLRPSQIAMYAAAILGMLISFGLARSGAMNHHEYAFTEFWMVPKGAVAGNIVTVGIRNSEKVPTTYDVALFADSVGIARRPGVTLLPGAIWAGDFSLNAQLSRSARVEAWLYRSEAPYDVYRKVWLSRPASANALITKDPR